MQIVTKAESFAGFGASIIPAAARLACERIAIPRERLEARAMIRTICPKRPGIYGMLDADDRLVYVGKSKMLPSRLLSYFDKNPADAKMTRIIQQAKQIVWEPVAHELLALIREQELISRWTPTMNRQGQPLHRKPVFVALSSGKAPHVFSTGRVSKRASEWFGPIKGSGRASDAAISMNYAFGLRDCPDRTRFQFDEQLSLFPVAEPAQCLRHELGSCLAPCTGECTKRSYRNRVEQARAFLNGKDLSAIDTTRQAMLESARTLVYERATVLRNRLDDLVWLSRRLDDLRFARKQLHGVYEIESFGYQTIWILLNGSFLASMILAPHDVQSWMHVADLFERASKRTETAPTDVHAVLLQTILVSWFRKHKAEKHNVLSYLDAFKRNAWANFAPDSYRSRCKRVKNRSLNCG